MIKNFMEILATIIFIVIVFTVCFIGYVYNWLTKAQAKKMLSPYADIPQPIVRTFNLETMLYSFKYTKLTAMERMYHLTGSPVMPRERVEYEKKRRAEKIGAELLEKGFIEVRERESEYNPFENEVRMRLRVYKEGRVEQTVGNGTKI